MIALKNSVGLVEHAKSKLGTPYVYGMKGKVLTASEYDRLKKDYGKKVWDSDRSKIGAVCVDCSGLISWYTGIERGSQQYHDLAKNVQKIATISDAPPGAAVWKQGHIGVYAGMENGVPMCIEAAGSANGTIKSRLPGEFTHWFLIVDIEYPGASTATAVQQPCNSHATALQQSVSVGDTVTIKPGAVYGGLYEKTRGKPVPGWVIAKRHTVKQLARG